MRTRSSFKKESCESAQISKIDPNNINETIVDESWVEAMQEELAQFEKNEAWNPVPPPKCQLVINTKWVFRNKMSESGNLIRKKATHVAQGYN